MLVGLNPTLTKKKARTVFELDNKKSPIYSYILNDVLQPSEIPLTILKLQISSSAPSESTEIIAGTVSGKGPQVIRSSAHASFSTARIISSKR
jgi:hypothetical protein